MRASQGTRLRLSPGPRGACWQRRASGELSAQAYQPERPFVSLAGKLLDRAISGLPQRAVDDGLLELWGKFRVSEILPQGGHRSGKMLHEVVNATRTAAQMKQEIGTHDSPTQPGSPTDSGIHGGDIERILVDEIGYLAIERRLQPMCDVADDLLPNMDRLPADRGIKGDGLLHRFRRGFLASDHLDQRDDMGRIQWPPDDAAFGMLASRLHNSHGQTRRTRCNDRSRRCQPIHFGEQFDLELTLVGCAFLHEIRLRYRLPQVGGEPKMLRRCFWGKAKGCECLPCCVDVAAKICFRAWRRIYRDHVEPASQVERCPTRADDAGAHNRDSTYGFAQKHDWSFPFARESSLAETAWIALAPSKRNIETSKDNARAVLLRYHLSNERVPRVLIACDQSDRRSDCEVVKDLHSPLVTYAGRARCELADSVLQVAADLVVVVADAEAVIGPAVKQAVSE